MIESPIQVVDKAGDIHINEADWKLLNETNSPETIKGIISEAIDFHHIGMPMRKLTMRNAIRSIFDLCSLDDAAIVVDEPWFTRYEYKYATHGRVVKTKAVGNEASDFFHQYSRWLCDSINAPSPYRTWYNPKFRDGMLNALWTLKMAHVSRAKLRTCISLRKYIASQFRPSAAKAVYNHFNAKHVLDFSSGWGDRLSGFFASNAESYVGIDPNKRLITGYKDQIELHSTLIPNKRVEMINGCAEEVDLGNRMFDTIFTSPPYFNIERYTQEENQSFKRHRKLDDWLHKFLFAALANVWKHLLPNGYMIINISDVYSNHTINQICDPMNDFIASLTGAEYFGCYGYEMRKRPNSGALKNKEGTFCEPMWVWRKQ